MMYVGAIMSTLGDVQYIRVFNINLKAFVPHMHHDIPQCTHDILMYSWYPPDVLNTHYTGCKVIYTLTGIKLYVLQCF